MDRIEQCKRQPADIRGYVLAMQQLVLAYHFSREERFCPACCLMKTYCFCGKILEISESSKLERGKALADVGIQVSLYVHFRELSHMRVSNTGKLLIHSCPLSSEYYICDVEDDESKFVEEIRSDLENHIILFPSNDAIPLNQFVDSWKKRQIDFGLSADDEKKTHSCKLKLVLLDGTWTNARYLHRRLKKLCPEVGRVALTEDDLKMIRKFEESSESHKHKLRSYQGSLKERGGTFAALLHVLQLLEKDMGIRKDTIEALQEVERIHEQSYNEQTNFQKLNRKTLRERQMTKKKLSGEASGKVENSEKVENHFD
eukprot:TRINITY_DN37262_c0_g1_i10.p1 TRINITY_DN37262_c0_g1~~TRINITY_DN37262_c0_g1_i10.p1  ORF type:complete len:354 (+),score=97.96 TRINITY_DN37262_c0_g1_i10:119-1063(+)